MALRPTGWCWPSGGPSRVHELPGQPHDNAQAESFIKTVKCEEVYLNDYGTYQDVVARLPRFLDQVYNEKRVHSALGYLSPKEYEVQHAQHAA